MWEIRVSGALHAALRPPASVPLRATLLSARGGERRAVVEVSSPERPALRTAQLVLPELWTEGAPLVTARQRTLLWGGLRPREGGLWSRIARLEREWLGERGALLSFEIEGRELRLQGYVERPEHAPTEPRMHEVEAAAPVFDDGHFVLALRPAPAIFAPEEGSLELKPIELETARVALSLGYYESPRRCTMDDIALALGITKSAVFHRMHGLEAKAVRRLLRAAPRGTTTLPRP